MVPNAALITADSTLVFPCHWDFTVALVDIEIFHTYKSFYPYDKLCAFKSKA
jgi:hypothetical protein